MIRKLLSPLRSTTRTTAYYNLRKSNANNGNEFSNRRVIVEQLKNRQIVRVSGKEVLQFLQGLITNDIHHLEAGSKRCIYAMFLNKLGRVLYDTIIYKSTEPDTYLIECDKSLSFDLRRHLRQYRVRRKIDIDDADKVYVPWVLFNECINDDRKIHIPRQIADDCIHASDPRVAQLGIRALVAPYITRSDFAKAYGMPGDADIEVSPPRDKCNYDLYRYIQGVGEGHVDLPPGKCFPLEANCDFLHGVSFHKGCYVGQELTARVHHTGVIRKRLMPMRLTVSINEGLTDVQSQSGAKIGNLRGVQSDRALALLRVEQALKSDQLMIDGDVCYVVKPQWWPKELPKKAKMLCE